MLPLFLFCKAMIRSIFVITAILSRNCRAALFIIVFSLGGMKRFTTSVSLCRLKDISVLKSHRGGLFIKLFLFFHVIFLNYVSFGSLFHSLKLFLLGIVGPYLESNWFSSGSLLTRNCIWIRFQAYVFLLNVIIPFYIIRIVFWMMLILLDWFQWTFAIEFQFIGNCCVKKGFIFTRYHGTGYKETLGSYIKLFKIFFLRNAFLWDLFVLAATQAILFIHGNVLFSFII